MWSDVYEMWGTDDFKNERIIYTCLNIRDHFLESVYYGFVDYQTCSKITTIEWNVYDIDNKLSKR